MKVWKNYRVWGVVFLCFAVIWGWRLTTVNNYKALSIKVEKEKFLTAPELKLKSKFPETYPSEEKGVTSSKELRKTFPTLPGPAPAPAPMTIPKEPVDVWDWVVKIGGGLTGLKTLLEIVDKFKRRKSNNES